MKEFLKPSGLTILGFYIEHHAVSITYTVTKIKKCGELMVYIRQVPCHHMLCMHVPKATTNIRFYVHLDLKSG